jgi:DNA-binding PadR family transcriptional regulator
MLMSKSIIMQTVHQYGYPQQKLQANPNYINIALKRLIDRRLIYEGPSGHYAITDAGRAELERFMC